MAKKTGVRRAALYVGQLALAVTAVLALGTHAFAEDDLLSLLGSDSSKTQAEGKSSEAAALRKAIGHPTAEQNIFIQFFAKGQMDKAMYQWPSAFEGTSFAKSPSGRALNALLLFRNGLHITALESLLAIESPNDIAPELLAMWKESAPDSHAAWGYVAVGKWHPFWTTAFGATAEVRVRGRQVYTADQTELVKELIQKASLGTRERAWLEWQIILGVADKEDPSLAAKALGHLMTVPNNPVSADLMTMTAARLLYQNGFLDAAIKYYEKVPKNSDYWFEAQEEMGWAFIRKGEPQNTIAITKTLVNPAFGTQVGPEPLFLRALSLLKACDYPEVVKALDLFRDRFRDRAKELLATAEKPENPAVQKLVARMKKEKVRMSDLGADATKLPRFVLRDETLAQLVQTEKVLEAEGKQAGDLYARSLEGGTATVGFQARLEYFKKAVDSRVQTAQAATQNRVKALAEEEVNEIGQILQKLHIVEAEVLQQISLSDRVIQASASSKPNVKVGSTGSRGSDRIWFPAENETWFDELSNYRVDIKKGCQSVTR